MADNYLLFSEQIDDLTEQEMDWLFDWLTAINARIEERSSGVDIDGKPTELTDGDDDESNPDEWESLGFAYLINRNDRSIWFHADEYGNVAHVGQIAYEFIRQFRPHASFTLTWASTCSKPRIGEFFGGGMYVDAGGLEFYSADQWIGEKKLGFAIILGKRFDVAMRRAHEFVARVIGPDFGTEIDIQLFAPSDHEKSVVGIRVKSLSFTKGGALVEYHVGITDPVMAQRSQLAIFVLERLILAEVFKDDESANDMYGVDLSMLERIFK